MSNVDPLDQLKAKYEFFIFKNKTHLPQKVVLANGNVAQVGERGTLKLRSSAFHQLPEFSKFKYEAPTFADLREVGLLKDIAPKGKASSPAPSSADDAE